MLKSTHRPAATSDGLSPLPEGWTEHRAPSGHSYYYNGATQTSTYIRPTHSAHHSLQFPPGNINGYLTHSYNAFGTDDFQRKNGGLHSRIVDHHPVGERNISRGRGGRGGYVNQQRPQARDRAKRKSVIPGCDPWVLVTTKLGRRFVYNSEKDESFWKFPPDVMKGVIEYDRLQREKRIKPEKVESIDAEDTEQAAVEAQLVTIRDNIPTAARAPASTLASIQQATFPALDSDGGEYEEIEVTDEEEEEKEEENPSKRQKTNERSAEQSVEFDENDIAFQLAAMGQDYGLDPGEYGDGEGEELEEGAEGLALTEDDAKALFKELLSDYGISPYTTWEKVIETGHIIEDERYTVLPNMRSRKVVWDEWAHAMIQHLKDEREKEEKKDPKIPYFAFLEKYATPKLYWPEFRRKYKKEPEMHNNKLSDKDREKWYREYISRLKLPESTLKADLVKLLKSTPPHALNRSTTLNTLPSFILTDHRYISLRPSIRDPMIETHISTLLPAPAEFPISPEEQETRARAKHDRERREKALGERQQQVQEEKRKQRVALQYSQGILREGENEVERAMKVGKEGLLGHMEEASRRVSMASSSEDAVSASCGLRGS